MQESFLEEAAPRRRPRRLSLLKVSCLKREASVLTWFSTQLCGAFSHTFTSVTTVDRGRHSQEEWPQGEARAAYN